jgi:AcrR family transcriptional regulator
VLGGAAASWDTARVAGEVGDKPTRSDAFRLARRRFLGCQRLDMNLLAAELGVNRVTLYRWLGSRNQLLTDVLWSIVSRIIEQEDERVTATVTVTGAERIVLVVVGLLDRIITAPAMQRLLAEEGELAMRLLTRHDAGFQPQLVAAMQRLLEEEIDAGRLDVPAKPREVAYVIVRLIESYTYLDLITGEQPDAARAEPILRMLLR